MYQAFILYFVLVFYLDISMTTADKISGCTCEQSCAVPELDLPLPSIHAGLSSALPVVNMHAMCAKTSELGTRKRVFQLNTWPTSSSVPYFSSRCADTETTAESLGFLFTMD